MTAFGDKENTISSENEHETEDVVSDDSHNMFSSFSFMGHMKISSGITVLNMYWHVLFFTSNLTPLNLKENVKSKTLCINSSEAFLCAVPGNNNHLLVLANEMFINVPVVPPLIADD